MTSGDGSDFLQNVEALQGLARELMAVVDSGEPLTVDVLPALTKAFGHLVGAVAKAAEEIGQLNGRVDALERPG